MCSLRMPANLETFSRSGHGDACAYAYERACANTYGSACASTYTYAHLGDGSSCIGRPGTWAGFTR